MNSTNSIWIWPAVVSPLDGLAEYISLGFFISWAKGLEWDIPFFRKKEEEGRKEGREEEKEKHIEEDKIQTFTHQNLPEE